MVSLRWSWFGEIIQIQYDSEESSRLTPQGASFRYVCRAVMDAYIAHPSSELVDDKPIANIPACTFSRKGIHDRAEVKTEDSVHAVNWRSDEHCMCPLTQMRTQAERGDVQDAGVVMGGYEAILETWHSVLQPSIMYSYHVPSTCRSRNI